MYIDPSEQRHFADWYHKKDDDPNLTEQVNEQWILSKYLKEISPTAPVTKVNNVHNGRKNNAIKTDSI